MIGAGNIARQHLAALAEVPDVSVAAICDLSRTAAEAAAERFGIAQWYTDHRSLLDVARPEVVHVTTPPDAHLQVALDALDAGAHVVVEKPAAPSYQQVQLLVARARERRRALVEDYNYLYNRPLRRLTALMASGGLGPAVHVEVTLCVDPTEGVLADYMSHLASLAHAFVGPHRNVSCTAAEPGELRALLEGERATAMLCFSRRSRPDTFVVTVHARDGRATVNLFESALVIETDRSVPRPLVPFVNGVQEAWTVGRAAIASFWHKLAGGPGTYEGLWEHLRLTYAALQEGSDVPVTPDQILEVNRLVADLAEGVAP